MDVGKCKKRMRKCVLLSQGDGGIRRKKAGKNHFLDKKSNKRKNHLGKNVFFSKKDKKRVKKMLNI